MERPDLVARAFVAMRDEVAARTVDAGDAVVARPAPDPPLRISTQPASA
jgi:hypothetical protein